MTEFYCFTIFYRTEDLSETETEQDNVWIDIEFSFLSISIHIHTISRIHYTLSTMKRKNNKRGREKRDQMYFEHRFGC